MYSKAIDTDNCAVAVTLRANLMQFDPNTNLIQEIKAFSSNEPLNQDALH